MTLFFAVALLVVFYLLVVAEFFLPTGGVLGMAGAAILIAAIVIAFSHSVVAGVIMIIVAGITTPMVLLGMLKVWPHTPIGRRMLNRPPGQIVEPPKRTTSKGLPLEELIGHVGVAKTDLLPSGLVVIDGEKLDAVSTGVPIDAGTRVVVTSVELGRIHVRPATDRDLADSTDVTPKSPESLEQSLESFDVD